MVAGDSPTRGLQQKTWLRQWRERDRLSQDECAGAVGVSRNRWSEIENDHPSKPAHDTTLAIERFTGIPPRDFFRTDPLGRKHKRKE